MMTLASGASTGRKAEVHKKSDQILLVLRGKLTGMVDQEKVCLKKGDVLLIPAGTPHRFTNKTRRSAVTFNVYAPPEYPVGTNG
jgi:mannose-6-phosphate isomerase-like protein (cupin superfamily)